VCVFLKVNYSFKYLTDRFKGAVCNFDIVILIFILKALENTGLSGLSLLDGGPPSSGWSM